MPTKILVDIPAEELTMVPSILHSKTIPSTQHKTKALVQPTINNKSSPLITKSVTVPLFRKKNGTWVGEHTRLVQVRKPKSHKKLMPNKKNISTPKKRFMLKFHSPQERSESASLAYSLRIQDVQALMRPKHIV
jgi:hypothetical protein